MSDNTPATPAVVPPVVEATAVKPVNAVTPVEAQPSEIDTMKAAHAEEVAKLRAEFQQERLQTAVRAARAQSVPSTSLGNSISRDQSIHAVGGNCNWHKLPAQQREAVLGVTERYSDDEIKKIFGHTSDAAEASRLATMNPRKYKALKVCAIERNLY